MCCWNLLGGKNNTGTSVRVAVLSVTVFDRFLFSFWVVKQIFFLKILYTLLGFVCWVIFHSKYHGIYHLQTTKHPSFGSTHRRIPSQDSILPVSCRNLRPRPGF